MSDKTPIYLSIVIPAFNEELRLTPALNSIYRFMEKVEYSFEVIVVDDGSKDKTSELVKARPEYLKTLSLIRQRKNHGKGYAVKLGVQHALGSFIIFVDADGATPIEEIIKLHKALEVNADIAIGSRALKQSNVKDSWHRKIMGITFNFIIRILLVKGIKDTQCGFKLFKGTVAKELFNQIKLIGFSFDVELLFLAQKYGYNIVEVPVCWQAIPGTKINPLTDSIVMFLAVLKVKLFDLLGKYEK